MTQSRGIPSSMAAAGPAAAMQKAAPQSRAAIVVCLVARFSMGAVSARYG